MGRPGELITTRVVGKLLGIKAVVPIGSGSLLVERVVFDIRLDVPCLQVSIVLQGSVSCIGDGAFGQSARDALQTFEVILQRGVVSVQR